MDTGKRQEKAFDATSDLARQLITLSTAIVAATTAFHKDIFGDEPRGVTVIMGFAWGLFLLSTLGGIGTLMGCVGALSDKDVDDINLTPRMRGILLPARFQVVCFLLGLLISVGYAVIGAIVSHKSHQ
jgi:hypothetical protein